MKQIEVYSLSRYSKVFATSNESTSYFFVNVSDHPYNEEPYRSETFAIGYLKKGSVIMQAGLFNEVIHAPAVITLAPTVIRSFSKETEEMLMDIIFFKESFFIENQADIFFLLKFPFFENADQHVFSLDGQQRNRMAKLFELIAEKVQLPSIHKADILRSYIYILIHEIDALRVMEGSKKSSPVVFHPIFSKFRQLLTKEFLRQRSVGFYADQLNVTAKHLSVVIKKQTGKTAGEIIDNAIVLEAKVMLQNRQLTVSQVSEQLNFSDQSVFGKFFKVNTGFSPVEYRKNVLPEAK